MITFLDGKLVSALPTQATIDVNGVGYEVFIPLSSYDKLPAVGQPIRILTHLAVRDLQTQDQAKSAEELVKLALKKIAGGR